MTKQEAWEKVKEVYIRNCIPTDDKKVRVSSNACMLMQAIHNSQKENYTEEEINRMLNS